MNIELKGSTNRLSNLDKILNFCRAAARVCYTKKDFNALLKEADENDLIKMTLKSGHHSVDDHVFLTFYMTEIPKFGAMLLNNEKFYVTSEKSARYTQMKPIPHQKKLYDKWKKVFEKEIMRKYPNIDEGKAGKLAQENARYLTSVFTPTKMLHTISFRQLNYIMHYFDEFMEKAPTSKFNNEAIKFMEEFNDKMKKYRIPDLKSLNERHLSLFAHRRNFNEEFGENYSTSYNTSLACLAQLHRHRTIAYEMQPILDNQKPIGFFIPPIFEQEKKGHHVLNWQKDMEEVSEYDFPQGQLMRVHESGSYTDFISKMAERLCGHAQLEIMLKEKDTLRKYLINTKKPNPDVYNVLKDYNEGPRCTFPVLKCRGACFFGKEEGIERLI